MSNNIDAIQRLIDYTLTVKPYHTKVYEVLTNCTYEEDVEAKVTDQLEVVPVPCVCEEPLICEGVGWGTQPFGAYASVNSGVVDERGNPIYTVEEDPDNIMWDAPNVCPPLPDPEMCCGTIGWTVVANLGWDTQPYSLHHWVPDLDGNGHQKSDVRGRPMYKVAPGGLEEGDAQYDYPYKKPNP